MKLVILYPGAMKPFHDGHLSLLEKYISNNDNIVPFVVHIIISPSQRNGINAETTYNFIKQIKFANINKISDIQIQISNSNPLMACYSICGYCNDLDTKFVLAASSKGDDLERVSAFNKVFSKGGKYYNPEIPDKIYHLNVDSTPYYYKNRTDNFNGCAISSTIVRYDIYNNDYTNFKTAYYNLLNKHLITENILKEYFNNLRQELVYTDKDNKKLNQILYKNNIDKQNIKTNKIYPMRRKLTKQLSSKHIVKLNISEMAKTCKYTDFNALRDALIEQGAYVEGQRGNGSLNESENTNKNIYMLISGLSEGKALNVICEVVSDYEDMDINPYDYIEDDVDETPDYVDIDEIDDIDDIDDIDNTDDEEINEYPDYDDVDDTEDIDDMDDYLDYDDVDIEECDDCIDPDLEKLDDAYKKVHRHAIELAEKRRSCCPGKKGKLISLSEALKAADPKKQKALEDSEKNVIRTIEDIVNSAKGNYITADTAKESLKKLQKEQKALSKIAKNDKGDTFKLTDVRGGKSSVSKALTTLKKGVKDEKVANQIDKFQKELKESVLNALTNNKEYLYENVKVNGKKLSEYNIEEIENLINEASVVKEKLVKSLKNNINESASDTLKMKIANKNRLLEMLDEELTYRTTRALCIKKLHLNEEQEPEHNGDFNDDDLMNMFGSGQTIDNGSDAESSDAESSDVESTVENDTEDVELGRIKITMQDMEAAEDLMQACIDAGIPEEAIELEDAQEDNNAEVESSDADAESDSANESLLYNNINRLFEDDETSDVDDNIEASSDAEDATVGPANFILIDTDYVNILADVLSDVYGITKEEFEDMIGGEIVDDNENTDEPAENNDSDSDVLPDDIDPTELFQGL